jgi:hypothetical protein
MSHSESNNIQSNSARADGDREIATASQSRSGREVIYCHNSLIYSSLLVGKSSLGAADN